MPPNQRKKTAEEIIKQIQHWTSKNQDEYILYLGSLTPLDLHAEFKDPIANTKDQAMRILKYQALTKVSQQLKFFIGMRDGKSRIGELRPHDVLNQLEQYINTIKAKEYTIGSLNSRQKKVSGLNLLNSGWAKTSATMGLLNETLAFIVGQNALVDDVNAVTRLSTEANDCGVNGRDEGPGRMSEEKPTSSVADGSKTADTMTEERKAVITEVRALPRSVEMIRLGEKPRGNK